MQRRICFSTAALVFAVLLNTVASAAESADWVVQHPTIQRLATLNNQHRARQGRAGAHLDPSLCLAAQRHAQRMAATGSFAHSGLPYREIIFQGVSTPEQATNGWIASPPHHGLMISGSQMGFGYAVANGRTYWVGLFR